MGAHNEIICSIKKERTTWAQAYGGAQSHSAEWTRGEASSASVECVQVRERGDLGSFPLRAGEDPALPAVGFLSPVSSLARSASLLLPGVRRCPPPPKQISGTPAGCLSYG